MSTTVEREEIAENIEALESTTVGREDIDIEALESPAIGREDIAENIEALGSTTVGREDIDIETLESPTVEHKDIAENIEARTTKTRRARRKCSVTTLTDSTHFTMVVTLHALFTFHKPLI